MAKIRIKDEEHELTAADIVAASREEPPRKVNSYFVEIDGKRFPPKQLLRNATKTKLAFDSGVAVRALEALGFSVSRVEGEGSG